MYRTQVRREVLLRTVVVRENSRLNHNLRIQRAFCQENREVVQGQCDTPSSGRVFGRRQMDKDTAAGPGNDRGIVKPQNGS
jgi:hypothetical protein